MVPRQRRGDLSIVYCALPSMTDAQIRQLAGFLLTDAKITYSNDDLEQIVSLSDGHPFNVKFLLEAAIEYTLPVALGDTTELTQWKRRRGSEFLRNILFTEEEKVILAALRDFSTLDFATIQGVVGREIPIIGKALARLMDFHVIEAANDTYQVAPPLRIAVGRDNRFTLDPERRREVLKVIADSLNACPDYDVISVSMIDAGILAALQEGNKVPPLFAAFLLPSHLVWLARHHYDGRRWPECARMTSAALEGVNRLSPAGKVEACRLLCLSCARMDRETGFQKGIAMLRTWADDSWARSNVHFLLGFNARLDGNLPQAEAHFREAYRGAPGNFSALRELAAICKIRGQLDQAETFARKAIETAPVNPYILDTLLSVLISCPSHKLRERELEIEHLFQKLKNVGEEEGRSFYTTRRAEYEFKHGSIHEARCLIDSAASKTSGIFHIHALRAEIYLEQGVKTVASAEIENMRRMVYRDSAGERRTNLRRLLEIEASYLAATGDYEAAKKIYGKRTVFTVEEAQAEISNIDYEQAMTRR
jgi:hypothetical protein